MYVSISLLNQVCKYIVKGIFSKREIPSSIYFYHAKGNLETEKQQQRNAQQSISKPL